MMYSTCGFVRFTRPAPFSTLVIFLLVLWSALVPAAEPQFEQVLHAGTTTVVLEHGGLVLRGLDGGGVVVHDIADNIAVEHWTSGQDLSGNRITDMAWTGQFIWIATLGGGMTRIADLEGNRDFRQYTSNLGDLNVTAVTGTVIGENERVFYGMNGKGVGQINSGLSGNIYTREEDGLISNDINALAMLGTELFVATPVGVSRFANNAFTDQNNGMSSLVVNDLTIDTAGNLLAATNTGIYRWETGSESWTRIGGDGSWIQDLASKDGIIYALGRTVTGTGTLNEYDGATWTPITLPYPECTAIDAGQYLWISGPVDNETDGGKLTFNYLGGQLTDGSFSTLVRASTQVANCEGVTFDSDGRAWMGDFFGRQISRYDSSDNSFFFLYERAHAGNDTMNLFPGLGPVLSIAGAPDGTVYAGQYAGGGVLKFPGASPGTTDLIDPNNSLLQGRGIVNMVVHPDGPLIIMHDWVDPQKVEVLVDPENWASDASWVLPPMDQGLGSGPTVWDALVERRDIIWFAVEEGGLVRWDINGPNAGPNDPLTWTDPSDDVWYDALTSFNGSFLDPGDAVALTLGKDGSIWVGGNGVVQFVYQLPGGTALADSVVQDLEEKSPATPETPGLINGNVRDLATDSNGDIWVSTRTGVNRVTPRGNEALVSAWTDLGNYLANPNYGMLYSPNIIAPLPGQTYARLAASPDRRRMLLSSDQGSTLITVGSGPGSASGGNDPLEMIYCYPNPWTPGDPADQLSLGRLPAETVAVHIYNVEGQLVYSDKFVAQDTGFWEGDNIRGQPVASGMYVLKITALGRTTTRVLAVVR